MSKLKRPYWKKTEVGIGVTIKRNTPHGKGRILSFSEPILQIELSELEASQIGWHLDPRSHKKKKELPE